MWGNYIKVSNIQEAISILHKHQGTAKVIAGGTDLILEIKKGSHSGITTLIDLSNISDIDKIHEENGIIHLGPLVTHAKVISSGLLRNKALPLVQACYSIGAPQIRNVGTVAGNIITASPANDTITALLALNAKVTLLSSRGKRDIPLNDFYTSVRQTKISEDEILIDVHFSGLKENQKGCFIKFGLRKAQAISLINVCVITETVQEIIEKAAVTIGCVAPTVIHSISAEKYLIGKQLSADVAEETGRIARLDVSPIDDMRSSAEYRSHLVSQIVELAVNHIRTGEVNKLIPDNPVILQSSTLESEKLLNRELQEIKNGGMVKCVINGKRREFKISSGITLIKFLRDIAGMKGSKESCSEGECGACTVLMDGKAVMGCLVPAEAADGKDIFTVENMANDNELHPIQQAFIQEGAVQCGYCTPGFLLVTKKLLEENPAPTREEIIEAVSGNFCRCTGYYKIIQAVEKSAELMR